MALVCVACLSRTKNVHVITLRVLYRLVKGTVPVLSLSPDHSLSREEQRNLARRPVIKQGAVIAGRGDHQKGHDI